MRTMVKLVIKNVFSEQDVGLMTVDYVKTCKGCRLVFTSGTGSAFCGSVCFDHSVGNVSTSAAFYNFFRSWRFSRCCFIGRLLFLVNVVNKTGKGIAPTAELFKISIC